MGTAATTDATSEGRIFLVGLGPGAAEHMSGRAGQAVAAAEVVIGCGKYIDLIEDLINGKEVIHDGIEQSWRFIQMWVATAPVWDKAPQSSKKIRDYSQLVKTTFDRKDIEWATSEIESDSPKVEI